MSIKLTRRMTEFTLRHVIQWNNVLSFRKKSYQEKWMMDTQNPFHLYLWCHSSLIFTSTTNWHRGIPLARDGGMSEGWLGGHCPLFHGEVFSNFRETCGCFDELCEAITPHVKPENMPWKHINFPLKFFFVKYSFFYRKTTSCKFKNLLSNIRDVYLFSRFYIFSLALTCSHHYTASFMQFQLELKPTVGWNRRHIGGCLGASLRATLQLSPDVRWCGCNTARCWMAFVRTKIRTSMEVIIIIHHEAKELLARLRLFMKYSSALMIQNQHKRL